MRVDKVEEGVCCKSGKTVNVEKVCAFCHYIRTQFQREDIVQKISQIKFWKKCDLDDETQLTLQSLRSKLQYIKSCKEIINLKENEVLENVT